MATSRKCDFVFQNVRNSCGKLLALTYSERVGEEGLSGKKKGITPFRFPLMASEILSGMHGGICAPCAHLALCWHSRLLWSRT